jgi:uncharacterized DUF497 family protein
MASDAFDTPDPKKEAANIAKHGLSLHDAKRFDFDTADVWEDASSQDERRFVALGRLQDGPVVVLVFTYRGDKVRAISLRKAKPKERRKWQNR